MTNEPMKRCPASLILRDLFSRVVRLSVGENNWNIQPLLMGVQNGAAASDNTLMVVYVVKLYIHHTTQQTHAKRTENTFTLRTFT